jgi:hypothetical protein
MNKLKLKELSHQKYESLTKDQKSKLTEYARTKLPPILQNSQPAIRFQILKYIKNKL